MHKYVWKLQRSKIKLSKVSSWWSSLWMMKERQKQYHNQLQRELFVMGEDVKQYSLDEDFILMTLGLGIHVGGLLVWRRQIKIWKLLSVLFMSEHCWCRHQYEKNLIAIYLISTSLFHSKKRTFKFASIELSVCVKED